MRKIYIFGILLVLCLSTSVYADDSKSRLGIKLLPGITNRSENSSGPITFHFRATLNYGIQYILTLKAPSVFLETGVYYVDRGSTMKGYFLSAYGNSSTYNPDQVRHNYYVNVPVLFRTEAKFFYLSVGPTFEYYVSSKFVWSEVNVDNPTQVVKTTTYKHNKIMDNIYTGIDLNTGLQFDISDKLSFFLGGSFHPSVFTKNPVYDEWIYYWNFELEAGLNLKL